MDEACSISVYSQNVNCDFHNRKLLNLSDDFSFTNRFRHIIKQIQRLKPDVVALNGVHHVGTEDELLVHSELKNSGYKAKEFPNSKSELTSMNFLAIRKDCGWTPEVWEHAWLGLDEKDIPHLSNESISDEETTFRRCAGIVYLKHSTGKRVCVATTHITAFGLSKHLQQKALLSLNLTNAEKRFCSPQSCPTILVGDLNRFHSEKEVFRTYLPRFKLREVIADRLVIQWESKINGVKKKYRMDFEDKKDIGTFSPWPMDGANCESFLKIPMFVSRLDAHLFTDNRIAIELVSSEVYPTMISPPDQDTVCPIGRNQVRHLLHRRMASDHLAMFSLFTVS